MAGGGDDVAHDRGGRGRTARALADFCVRALDCGAVTADEITEVMTTLGGALATLQSDVDAAASVPAITGVDVTLGTMSPAERHALTERLRGSRSARVSRVSSGSRGGLAAAIRPQS